MASERENTLEQKTQSGGEETSKGGKVGSDRAADREIGGKLDFGIPAKDAIAPLPDGGREKGPGQGTGPMRSGARGVRDSGVGHAPGKPGTGSGGDLDPDIIGLDHRGGVSASPASGRTKGPDITEGGSDAFASGPPAEGRNEAHIPKHGGPTELVRGSTVDRSGGDATTTGQGGGADSAGGTEDQVASTSNEYQNDQIPDNAAVGEISSGEAGGQGG
jgi:hypothetical protein